jgi:glycosyltransferase involved in cell wall biosynthesis
VTATIVIAGSIAQRPRRPGHAWALLAYALGFRELGYEVVFVDRLDQGGDPAWLAEAMTVAGLDGRWALLGGGTAQPIGLSRPALRRELERAELLLNVNGFLTDPELLEAARRRVYLDLDPGFGQIWAAQGLADTFAGHDDFVTVGTNLGGPGCTVPLVGREWIPTLPPVPLRHWPVIDGGRGFTSVGSWRGPFGPLEHEGRTLGLRAHEFRRFAALPRRIPDRFEVALDIDPADAADRARLEAGGWDVVDPLRELGDFSSYARYLRGSAAEISIAKQLYVATRGGWFSDRSAAYLASGKPVVAQDTGFDAALPTGAGLLSFADPDGAVAALEEVAASPREHARAARGLAEEHLDARRVLGRLLDRLGAR